jgi:hypothetical protein
VIIGGFNAEGIVHEGLRNHDIQGMEPLQFLLVRTVEQKIVVIKNARIGDRLGFEGTEQIAGDLGVGRVVGITGDAFVHRPGAAIEIGWLGRDACVVQRGHEITRHIARFRVFEDRGRLVKNLATVGGEPRGISRVRGGIIDIIFVQGTRRRVNILGRQARCRQCACH